MKRFHIALAVADVDASITDYSKRLGQTPQVAIAGTYAMWRTDQLNFSISQDSACAGQMRHVGFEDDEVKGFRREADINGIEWENFSALAQDLRIVSTYGVSPNVSTEEELIRN